MIIIYMCHALMMLQLLDIIVLHFRCLFVVTGVLMS